MEWPVTSDTIPASWCLPSMHHAWHRTCLKQGYHGRLYGSHLSFPTVIGFRGNNKAQQIPYAWWNVLPTCVEGIGKSPNKLRRERSKACSSVLLLSQASRGDGREADTDSCLWEAMRQKGVWGRPGLVLPFHLYLLSCVRCGTEEPKKESLPTELKYFQIIQIQPMKTTMTTNVQMFILSHKWI